jgi:uncharacterized protein YndB with AHSA1/START domain
MEMKKQSQTARAIADVTEGTLLATVTVAASIERVFQALTSEQELPKWWGEDGLYHTTKWTLDLRVGGKWRADGVGADGAPFFVEGEYLEVEPPNKLVHTWRPAWDVGPPTKITYRLSTVEDGTLVSVKHTGFGDRTESCASHANGWERVLGWLQFFAAKPKDAAVQPKYFLCRLIPPRPSFPFDMSEQERAIMQEHVAYWSSMLADGKAIVFGPVADPSGPWGLGILRVADEAELRSLQEKDPAIRAAVGLRFESLPMLQAVHGA